MAWTNWQSINEPQAHNNPAQYELRIIDGNGQPFTIDRMLGQDNLGILKIGQTQNMESRRKQFGRRSGPPNRPSVPLSL